MERTHGFSMRRGEELWVWNVERLWELARELPVEMVVLEQFERYLMSTSSRFWPKDREQPTGLETAAFLKSFYDADLSYPIILSAEGDLMDGFHRVTKAWVLGLKEIRAVRFSRTPEPDERRPFPE